MARADKATAVADIADAVQGRDRDLDHRIPRFDGSQPGRAAPVPVGIGHLLSGQEHAHQAGGAEAGIEGLDELFAGPTAIAFVTGEPVDAAKAIKTFAKEHKALVIKGGYMDGHPLTVAEVERIADLESREVLLAKLAGAMKGNLAKAAGLFNAPASQVARLVAALQEKKAAEGHRRLRQHPRESSADSGFSRITQNPETRKDPPPCQRCLPTTCSMPSRK